MWQFVRIAVRYIAVATLAIFSVSPSYGQVCRESTATSVSGAANTDCDMRYRDSVVACSTNDASDVIGTRPSCPPKPMPMIDTPKRSYIANYSPLLFAYPRDEINPALPYTGPYSIGTTGDFTKTTQMIGNAAAGSRQLAACKAKLNFPGDADGSSTDAKIGRLLLDNCTNEYILNSSIYPFQKENVRLRSIDDPENPGKLLNMESECQPLSTDPSAEENEYSASTYLELAWKKTLQDPGYRKTTPGALKCVPCVSKGIPCDREPHLACGTTITSPVNPPSPFPEVLLSSIAALPYEEIVDPTHPFSPRWDFLINDREYSKPSASWASVPKAAAINALMRIYMTDPKDTIFCAGLKKANLESVVKDAGSTAKDKDDIEIPVDVLEFRRKHFESTLDRRAAYNAACYMNIAPFGGAWVPLLAAVPVSYCYNIKFVSHPPYIYTRGIPCWRCFGLSGKVDDELQHPPCTARYNGKDLKMKRMKSIHQVLPGGLNLYDRKAQCNYPLLKRDVKYDMDKVCADLRKPFTPLNKLKMRYHNPDDMNDPDGANITLKEGVPEGMTFKEYFGHHMPYPRLWDTEKSLHKIPPASRDIQAVLDTTGQYTAIVGVGREAAAKAASDNAPEDENGKKREDIFNDQRCKTMGWGGVLPTISAGGATIALPDPMTSWSEFKLYQTRTLRNIGISCLGRYEKVFKPGGAENMLLLASGAEWSKLIITKCPRGSGGTTGKCDYLTLKEYTDSGSVDSNDTTLYIKELSNQGIPNSWRGYLAADKSSVRFPAFGGGSATGATGLDRAELGDIILMPNGPGDNPVRPGLAKLALVIETNLPGKTDCASKKNCYVKVLEPDNGKYPDICGTTDSWGKMKSRYYFKPGSLPEDAGAEYARIHSSKDCEETGITHCEMSAWERLKVYRIRNDERIGCDKSKATDCEKDD